MSTNEQKHLIEGLAGTLEISVHEQPGATHCAIISHPHPLHGGTMNNKVVTTLAKGYQLAGMTTLRYNYRGVGQSEGQFAEGIGESDDLQAVIDWQQHVFPGLRLQLAGFSFGTFVTLHRLQQLDMDVDTVILVAPPVHHFNFGFQRLPQNWLVFQCDDDEIVPAVDVYQWLESMGGHAPELSQFKQAGHFFHGRLIELREKQLAWLEAHVSY